MNIISPSYEFDEALGSLVVDYDVGIRLSTGEEFDFHVDSITNATSTITYPGGGGFAAFHGRRVVFSDEVGAEQRLYAESTEEICLVDIDTLKVY